MQTSQKSIFDIIEETSTSSAGAFPANPTQAQASDLEKKMTATSGLKCCDAFERFPRVGSWARMFSALLIGMEGWSSMRCRLIWKLKASKSNRMYFQLQASTLPTEGTECGLLLGTPRAQERPRSEKFREGRTPSPIEYAEQFKGLLLTPTSVMTDEPPEKMRERAERNGYKNGTQYGSLLSQVKYSAMLPTPTTDSATNRKEKYKQGGTPLSVAVNKMLPTPTASAANGGGSAESLEKRGRGETNCLASWATLKTDGKNSQLNPQFVEEMMGFPENWTASPFQSGETKASKPTGTQ